MNRKKSVVLVLLLVVIFALTSCLLAACNPDAAPAETETVEATEGLLIPNSDLKVIDTSKSDFPRSATNWSGAKMYSSSSFRDDVVAGVVSLADSDYSAHKSEWDDSDEELRQKLLAGGHFGDDDEIKHVLMVYQPQLSKDNNGNDQHGPTAYGFTSASFTLSKGSYYEISVDVLTYNVSGPKDEKGEEVAGSEPGARIYVSSNTYAEFASIDTDGKWETYKIYIETSPVSTTSLSLQLGLGKYTSSYSDGLTTGYAFFDNISLKKLVEDPDIKDDDIANKKVDNAFGEFLNAYEQEQNEKPDSTVHYATTTLKVPNGRFEFGSYNLSNTNAPNSWTLVTGNSGLDDPAPTGYGYNAIIDTTKFNDNYEKYATSYKTKASEADPSTSNYNPASEALALQSLRNAINDYKRVGDNVFMLSQQFMTAQGIRSSRSITIEKGKTYALSVSLFTAYVKGAGVSLILSGSDSKDIVIKGIAEAKSDNIYLGGINLQKGSGYGASESGAGVTSDNWTTYTFYIKGNAYKDYSYNMSIWLGTDGTSSNYAESYYNFSNSSNSVTYTANGTFSSGWLFIDELNLKEITADELQTAKSDPAVLTAENGDNTLYVGNENENPNKSYTGLLVDLSSDDNRLGAYLETGTGKSSFPDAETVSPLGLGAPNGWKSNYDLSDNENPRIKDFISEGIVDISSAESWTGKGAYPGLPYSNLVNKHAYSIYSAKDSYYEVETDKITIQPNRFYRISFWLKTVDVKSTSGAYVYVLNKTAQEKNIAEKDDDSEVVMTSFTRINTADYDDYLNDWCEINIVIRGDNEDATDIALKFTLGYGNRWASSTLTSGAMYVANFNMTELTYANYSGTSTGTYTKTYDLSSSYTYTFTNGSFDNYDHDDENLKNDDDHLHLYDQDVAATPSSWTLNDATLPVNQQTEGKAEGLFAGVISLERDETEGREEGLFFGSSHQATTATGIDDESFFNNFYGDKTSDAYYDEQNLRSIAGPNVLALGSADGTPQAAGFASNSLTLSANTFNVLTIYAKTYGPTKASIYISGESSGSGDNDSVLKIESSEEAGSGWVKYSFYIEVGKNSVSIKLNLWIGEDISLSASKDDSDYEAKAEAAKSSGRVFFDNIISTTVADKETFDEQYEEEEKNGTVVRKLSFTVDSFDPLSSSVDSRRSLSSPNGWTGAAGTNQSTSNTKSGIIYTGSTDYYETKEVDEQYYVGILGKDYQDDDSSITVTEEEISAERTAHPEYSSKTNSEVRDIIAARKLHDLKVNNWLPVGSVLNAHSGDHMLVINNMTKSAYTYTSTSNTLKSDTYYQVTVWARTYGLNTLGNDDDFKDLAVTDQELNDARSKPEYVGKNDDEIRAALLEEKCEQLRNEKGVGAYIELYLGSANETKNPFVFEAVRSTEWKAYNFFVKTQTDDVTSVTVKLSLGNYISKEIDGKTVITGLTTGYAMFDDISIKEIDEDSYNSNKAKADPDDENYDPDEAILVRELPKSTTGTTPGDTDGNTETPSNKFNLEYLWWMIPTIVLGLVIIVVLVIFVIRKLRKSPADKPAKVRTTPTTPTASKTLDEKHDKYDEDKE